VAADLNANPGNLNLADDAGQTPLHLGAVHCRTNVVALLLEKGAKVDAVMKGNATPLHLAAQAGCSGAVILLLSKGAHINFRDGEGRTPLTRAKQWHQNATAQLLQEGGGTE
jgi:ankyrin repeat protein